MFGKFIGLSLIMLLGVGCSRGNWAKPGTTARLERAFFSAGASNRIPAQEGAQCLRDRLGARILREEINEQENRTLLPRVSGRWRDLDLGLFPPIQAKFLQANESWVSSELGAGALAECQDLFCVFKKLYQVDSDEEAIRIYSFYKHTGYLLPMKDFVPQAIRPKSSQPSLSSADQFEGWNFPNRKLNDFLFNRQQLEAFSRLSVTLPPSLLHLRSLQRFHRVPLRLPQEDSDPMQEWDDMTCADYFGSPQWGMIRARRCIDTESNFKHLENDFPKNKESGIAGDFYLTLSHEIFHAWDTQSAESTGGDPSFSTTAQWLSLSGWHSEDITLSMKEYEARYGQRCSNDPATTVCLVHDWVVDPSKDGFVGEYATTNPFEDFADTASWVRYSPKLAQERSPAKAALVSQIFYGGRTFDRAGLKQFYLDSVSKKVDAARLEITQACAVGPPAELDKCKSSQTEQKIAQAIAELKANEWEACDYFDEEMKEFQTELAQRLGKEQVSTVEMAAVRDLHETLARNLDPREAYLRCWKEEQNTQEDCYRRVLVDAFLSEARPFMSALGDQLDREKQTYLEENALSRISANTRGFYSQALLGVEPRLKREVESIWSRCMSEPVQSSNSELLKLTLYSGGDHYVQAGLLSCINEQLPAVLQQVRKDELSSRGAPSLSSSAEAFLDSLLLVPALGFVRDLQSLAQFEEDRIRAARKDAVIDRLVQDLLANRSWMEPVPSSDEVLASCRNEAFKAFDAYLSKLSPADAIPVRFEALSNIRFNVSHEACTQVLKSNRIVQEVGKREAQRWAKVMNEAEQYVLKRSEDLVTDCKARVSGASATAKKKRVSCVRDVSAWSLVEAQALVDWDRSSEGRRWAKKRGELQAHFKARRIALQKRAVLPLEKGQ